jgi:hypothetical protein
MHWLFVLALSVYKPSYPMNTYALKADQETYAPKPNPTCSHTHSTQIQHSANIALCAAKPLPTLDLALKNVVKPKQSPIRNQQCSVQSKNPHTHTKNKKQISNYDILKKQVPTIKQPKTIIS